MPELFPSPDIGPFGRRQRHVRGHRIPVTIATDRAANQRDRGTAIVIDEFGADDVMALPEGCPCCTVRAKLQITLRRLLVERARKPFTRIAIVTQEDIGPILRTFAGAPALEAEFYVEDSPPPAGDHGVSRFVLTAEAPLSWDAFSRFITTLQALRGVDLLHAKGVLNIAGCRGPVAVQFIQHLAHQPVELAAWPSKDRRSQVAFVTHNIEEAAVRRMFEAVRVLS